MRAHQPGSTPIDIPEPVPNPAYTPAPAPAPAPERAPTKVPEKVPEKVIGPESSGRFSIRRDTAEPKYSDPLFNHLIGASEQHHRHVEAESLGGF